MGNNVNELIELINDDSKSLSVILRKVLSSQSSQLSKDQIKWINWELNGYEINKDIPDYRKIRGVVKAHNPYNGWIPIQFQTSKDSDQFSIRNLGENIHDIEELYNKSKADKGSFLTYSFSSEVEHYLQNSSSLPGRFPFALIVQPSVLHAISTAVRNKLFEILLELQKNDEIGDMPEKNIDSSKVFIVHGHDNETKIDTARFIEKLGLEAVILHEQASSGNTIIEKIEEYTNVGFGIVLYTPCDVGANKDEEVNLKKRARQNVVFEHGYLIGKLGRKRVCALVKDELELPNDISGVVYVQKDKNEAWKLSIAKEMKQVGYDIDLNKLV